MHRFSILTVFLLTTTSVIAQNVDADWPLGCYVRDYSADHLARHPDQVVDRMSILFTQPNLSHPTSGLVWAEIQVLLADQGHAARSGFGGLRVAEVAASYGVPFAFGVDCDGGRFEVVAHDAAGITIETDRLNLRGGCGPGDNIYTTLAEIEGETTAYKMIKADEAACHW